MFLDKNNRIDWKKILVATIVVVAICILGVHWFDAPVYLFLRKFNWIGWDVLDTVFAVKNWLLVFFIIAAVMFIKNVVKSKNKIHDFIPRFKIGDFYDKIRLISNNNSWFVIFCSVLSASVVVGILKIAIGRARPIFLEALNHTGFYPGNAEWAFNSMPSGHAAASFAGGIMILLLIKGKRNKEKRIGQTKLQNLIPFSLFLFPCIIGMSRICVGVHFPSDVILGAFIGICAADLVKSFFYKK